MNNKKLKILDLCCKAGGASMGYYNAALDLGYDVKITGVDIMEQPNYPFKFIKMDAVKYLKLYSQYYDFIHISPPCQPFSNSCSQFRNKGKVYNDILSKVLEVVEKINKPLVIENVMSSPLRGDIILAGNVFGLKVIRKRKFDLYNVFLLKPGIEKQKGTVLHGDFISCYGNGHFTEKKGQCQPKFKKESVNKTWSFAMDIDWMTTRELAEAIPPAYTKYLGTQIFS